MSTILITGGAGFIGSHLCERLADEGDDIIMLDNFDDYYDPEIKQRNMSVLEGRTNIRFIQDTVTNEDLIESIFSDNDIDVVVHLAAKAGVRNSIQYPKQYFRVNVLGTLNILEAMKTHGCKKLVLASTSSVYGDNEKVPFQEDDEVSRQLSPYAVTKRSCELTSKNFHRLHGLNIWCLRFFTVYGPRQRPDMAISKFLRAAHANEPISIYGDGSMKRDFTYISDIVSGVANAARNVNGFEIINIGGSHSYTIHEMVDTIERVTGNTIQKQYLPVPPGDVPTTQADTSKAARLLDFSAQVSLEEGIRKQWAWFLETAG